MTFKAAGRLGDLAEFECSQNELAPGVADRFSMVKESLTEERKTGIAEIILTDPASFWPPHWLKMFRAAERQRNPHKGSPNQRGILGRHSTIRILGGSRLL